MPCPIQPGAQRSLPACEHLCCSSVLHAGVVLALQCLPPPRFAAQIHTEQAAGSHLQEVTAVCVMRCSSSSILRIPRIPETISANWCLVHNCSIASCLHAESLLVSSIGALLRAHRPQLALPWSAKICFDLAVTQSACAGEFRDLTTLQGTAAKTVTPGRPRLAS